MRDAAAPTEEEPGGTTIDVVEVEVVVVVVAIAMPKAMLAGEAGLRAAGTTVGATTLCTRRIEQCQERGVHQTNIRM